MYSRISIILRNNFVGADVGRRFAGEDAENSDEHTG